MGRRKKSKKKTLKCSTAQKHTTGFQLVADLLIESFQFFVSVKSAKMENLSIFLHQTQGQTWMETMQQQSCSEPETWLCAYPVPSDPVAVVLGLVSEMLLKATCYNVSLPFGATCVWFSNVLCLSCQVGGRHNYSRPKLGQQCLVPALTNGCLK